MSAASRPGRRRRGRLSRSAEFERVYRRGRSHGNRFLVLYEFPREEAGAEGPRLGVSVGRKVGGAVQRNGVKRALREAFWELSEQIDDGCDYVVVGRPDIGGLLEREGADGVRTALDEVIRRTSTDETAE